MGKKSQIRRGKKEIEDKDRKETRYILENKKIPLSNFWRRIDFWIYSVCVLLIIAFPFVMKSKIGLGDHAIIHTSMGDIEVEIYRKDTPQISKNFIKLAGNGYYDNLAWHRVIKDFMIQGGDPKGDGTGGESAFGGVLPDEINADALGLQNEIVSATPSVANQLSAEDKTSYGSLTVKDYYQNVKGYTYSDAYSSHKMVAGSLAMANSGPNTNGSQFFIVTEQDQPHLDGLHTVFGKVTKGLDIAVKISEVPVDDQDKPKEPVYITSVEIK